MKGKSLSHFSELINENHDKFKEKFSKLSEAAEAVNQSFQTLFEYLTVDRSIEWHLATVLMAVPAHMSWINSYIFSTAGYIDSSFTEIRRAIEFACYASKVKNNKERSIDWLKQRTEIEVRKKFINWSSIPLCYTNDKYSKLRPLLIAYDTANYYGAHATFETLAYRIPSFNEEQLKIYYQSNKDVFPLFPGYIIILGYQIIKIFQDIFKDSLKEKEKFDEIMDYNNSQVKQSQIIMVGSKLKKIPDSVINSIYNEDMTEVNKLFNEYICRETERKKKE